MAKLVIVAAMGVIVGVVVGAAAGIHAEGFDQNDTLAALEAASASTGVSYAWLHRVVGCETGFTWNPAAVGDYGTSFGAAQLHRGGGELPRFYAFGFSDPFNPYEAVTFMAQEFAVGRASAWSCR